MPVEPVVPPEENVGVAVTVVPVGTYAQANVAFPELATSAATPFIEQDDITAVALALETKTMKRFSAAVDVALTTSALPPLDIK
jgi:hypothetical protein